jgi:hypothetical protein
MRESSAKKSVSFSHEKERVRESLHSGRQSFDSTRSPLLGNNFSFNQERAKAQPSQLLPREESKVSSILDELSFKQLSNLNRKLRATTSEELKRDLTPSYISELLKL